MFTASAYSFFVIGCRGKATCFKTASVHYVIFKVPAFREEIGDPLDMYGVNHDNSPTKPLFGKCRKKIRLLLWGGL